MRINFTTSEFVLLQELQRNTSDRDSYQKLTVLIMLHQKHTPDAIALALGIHPTTVYRYIKDYELLQNFEQYIENHYVPCAGKLSAEELLCVADYVATNLCLAAKEVQYFIKNELGIDYTTDGVIALLHRLYFSYKKTKLVPSGANIDKQIAWIDAFKTIEKELPVDEIILFGDGVHPHHNTVSTYAWIPTGKEKEIASNSGRERLNIIGAIDVANPTKVVTLEVEMVNALTIIAFLQAIEKAYPNKKVIHLFVDNARYHHAKIVQEYLKNSTIQMHFLPPYSPNLNPIERFWKLLKKEVISCGYIQQFEGFKEKIRNFLGNLTVYKDELETLITTNFRPINSPLYT